MESSKSLNSLDPGLRRDDMDSGSHLFMDGHGLVSGDLTESPMKAPILTAFLIVVVLLSFTDAMAERGSRWVVAESDNYSLDSAVSKARKRSKGGRVVRAETGERDGRRTHDIRIYKDGRVKRYRMDAETGRLTRPGRKR